MMKGIFLTQQNAEFEAQIRKGFICDSVNQNCSHNQKISKFSNHIQGAWHFEYSEIVNMFSFQTENVKAR